MFICFRPTLFQTVKLVCLPRCNAGGGGTRFTAVKERENYMGGRLIPTIAFSLTAVQQACRAVHRTGSANTSLSGNVSKKALGLHLLGTLCVLSLPIMFGMSSIGLQQLLPRLQCPHCCPLPSSNLVGNWAGVVAGQQRNDPKSGKLRNRMLNDSSVKNG